MFILLETQWRIRLNSSTFPREDFWICEVWRQQFVLVSFSLLAADSVEFPLNIQLASWTPLDDQLVLVSEDFYNLAFLCCCVTFVFSSTVYSPLDTHTHYIQYTFMPTRTPLQGFFGTWLHHGLEFGRGFAVILERYHRWKCEMTAAFNPLPNPPWCPVLLQTGQSSYITCRNSSLDSAHHLI